MPLSSSFLLGQSRYAKHMKKPLIIFPGKDTVSVEEFLFFFQKNETSSQNQGSKLTKCEEYLNRYILFKQKVLYARDLGLDTLPSVKQEIRQYLDQAAKPYLEDRELRERLLQEAMERANYEVAVSHIFVKVPPDASPEDTLKAYQRIMALRDSVTKGQKPFDEIAKKYSDDPYAKQTGGYIGYFTVFDMVYPFETAAYNTPVGEISMPVRTKYGYHILKVHDKAPLEGLKRVAHIFVRWGPAYEAKTEAEAKKRIEEVYQKLQAGESWDKLAATYSDDPLTKNRGGDLGYGRLLLELDSVRRQLKEGEYSKPFRSPYGWHILKVTEVKRYANEQEKRNEFKIRLQNDERNRLAYTSFIKKLKEEYHYQVNDSLVQYIKDHVGVRYYSNAYVLDSFPKSLQEATLVSFANQEYPLKDFWNFKLNQRRFIPQSQDLEQIIRADIDRWGEQLLLAYEKTQLPRKYKDYRYLAQEYEEGLLLFNVMNEEVWKRAIEDTAGLRQFYESHLDSFQSGPRIVVYQFDSRDSNDLAMVRNFILQDKENVQLTRIRVDSLIRKLHLAVQGTKIIMAIDENQVAKELAQNPLYTVTPIEFHPGGYWTFYYLIEKREAGILPFDEAQPKAITLYQRYLEDKWIQKLQAQYPYRVNGKLLKKICR